MGVKFFFKWLQNTIPTSIKYSLPAVADVLLIDMNALYHNVAQKVYKYGNYKQPPRLLAPSKPTPFVCKNDVLCDEICNEIKQLIIAVKPRQKIVLCVDGVAPLSKQNQQRLRRFKSILDSDKQFDSNSISPGTLLMHKITTTIDKWIKKMLSDKDFKHLQFIFSSEKSPGEGEHKIVSYLRKYHTSESCCIVSLDADLIMLLLSTHHKNLHILRLSVISDDCCLDIDIIRDKLCLILVDEKGEEKVDEKTLITDFIILCFFIGNDFLPTIPTMEIMDGAIDIAISKYKQHNQPLSTHQDNTIAIIYSSLTQFLLLLCSEEENMLLRKIKHITDYYDDPILTNNIKNDTFDYKNYRHDYYTKHFDANSSITSISHQYLSGMIWNINYYTFGITDWTWTYPHHYGPFLCDLAESMKTFKPMFSRHSKPNTPFIQLLSILPPQSRKLLPIGLEKIYENKEFNNLQPEKIMLDYSGKKNEWEAIVTIPHLNQTQIELLYSKYDDDIKITELERNIEDQSYLYFSHPQTLKTTIIPIDIT